MAQDQLDVQKLASKYGVAAALLNQVPELQQLFNDLLQRKVTNPDDINAALLATSWMQKHTDQYIRVQKDRASKDPAIWNATIAKIEKQISDQYIASGATVPDKATLTKMAEQTIYGGELVDGQWENYDEDWLKKQISGAIDWSKTQTVNGVTIFDQQGAAEDTATALYKLADAYGVNTSMSNNAFTSWFQKTAKAITDGSMSQQDADDEVKNMALSRFPGLASQLAKGLTLKEAADPYMNVLAATLDLTPNDLGYEDDLVQRVLNSVDDSGNFKPMSLYDAKKAARKDPRWQYTETARNEYTSIASKIAQDFGFLG